MERILADFFTFQHNFCSQQMKENYYQQKGEYTSCLTDCLNDFAMLRNLYYKVAKNQL